MYIIKLEGQLLWSTPPVGVYQENLAFRLQARFSEHPSTLIKGGKDYYLEKIINTEQLDAWAFSMCLQELADEIMDMLDQYQGSSSS